MPPEIPQTSQEAILKRSSLQLILLLGLVSAFGDITYESARSISPILMSRCGP